MADGHPPRDPPRIDGRSVLIGALLVAAVANVVQFRAIEQAMGTAYMVLATQAEHDLADLVHDAVPTVRERFELYLTVAQWAPDADVTLPPGTGLNPEELYGLGRIARLTVLEHDPDLTLPDGIDDATVADGEDRHAGSWVLAVSQPPAHALVGFRVDDVLYLVDARLIDADLGAAP